MKWLFLIIPLFVFFIGCTTVQNTSKTYPYDEIYTTELPIDNTQEEVYLNTEAYTNPTLTPYTNIYLDVNPFHWYWGSYYSYPTYFYSYYYYSSIWSPYWYNWYPLMPYYYDYYGYGYSYYYGYGHNNYYYKDSHDYYYGHRNGYSPNLPPQNPVTPPRGQRIEPNLTKPQITQPKYAKPQTTYSKPKIYTPSTNDYPKSKYEYRAPSTKNYTQPKMAQPKTNYQPQQKYHYQSQPRTTQPATKTPSSKGGK